ncbi:uncharacterized protein LOC120416914 [Culex pipiens pallens]|uniref:uncharacterized protein LOC120416914 n=1 Tax=Culex pipiens pallens TaxID=42434 RepID=UPI00195333AB|nr:uncharacterized protein LOC120416914 [Culex pipiens pallens]
MEFCEKCGQVVTLDSVSVTCADRCERTFHAPCVNLSAAVADSLAADDGLRWFYDQCRRGNKRKLASTALQRDSPQLPAEIWVEIFNQLSSWQLLKVRLVCRRWRDIVDGSLNARFTVRFPKLPIIDREYEPVQLPLPVIEFYFDQTRIAAVGSWWASFGPNLTGITMVECKIMLPNLLAMLRQTVNLTRLELHEVIVDMYEANPVPDFRLDKLQLLVIEGVNRAENLELFREICPNLGYLQLVSCYLDERSEAFLRHVVDFVAVRHASLNSLEVDGDDLLLSELIKLRQWKLEKLVLRSGDFAFGNVRALVELCRMVPWLVELGVEPGVSAWQEITRIGQLLPNLKKLELTLKGNHQNKPSFLTRMAGLQVLQLKYDTLTTWFLDFDGIVCPHLHTLVLEHINCVDSRLAQFLASAPKLRVLSLSWCKFDCWTEIFRTIAPCRRLQRLTLKCIEADDYNRCFFDYLDDLRYLEVHKCDEIPQEMLATLLSLCPRLEELALTCLADKIDEEILRVICEKLHRLVRVKIIGCELSERDAGYVRANCHVLESVLIAESFV